MKRKFLIFILLGLFSVVHCSGGQNISGEIEEQINLKPNETQILNNEKYQARYEWGYITLTKAKIRKAPTVKATVIGTYPLNKKIKYYQYNKKWFVIQYKKRMVYIHHSCISDKPIKNRKFSIPHNSGFKSYMSYKAITSKTSPQYKLQKIAYTGKYGIRQIHGYYCVAVGTGFGANIGDYANLILNNGEEIPIIISDIKANNHTEANNIVTSSNGCVSEFLVDTSVLNKKIAIHGDVSHANKKWNSKVVAIMIYNKNIFE